NTTWILRSDLHGDFFDQSLELQSLRHKITLAVNLYQHTKLTACMDIGSYRAFRGNPPSALGSLGNSLLTQPSRRLLEVAFALCQRLFTIHNAGSGLIAQLSDEISVYVHSFPENRASRLSSCRNLIIRLL